MTGSLWVIAVPLSGHRRSIRPQSLANGQQRELQLPAQHGAHAQSAQQRLVHGGVEPVDAEVGLRGEPPDVGQGLHRDAGGGMHAHIKSHQVRIFQDVGIELLQRKIEASHRKALALQQGSRLRQGKRLPPQFIGIDEDDLEGRQSLRAHATWDNIDGESRGGGSSYFDFGRCSKGAGPGSRLAPASSRRSRYCRHSASRLVPSQNR